MEDTVSVAGGDRGSLQAHQSPESHLHGDTLVLFDIVIYVYNAPLWIVDVRKMGLNHL